MRVWLLQRAEPTPHDNEGAQRLLRTGILARTLVEAGHQVTWWTSTFDHYNREQRHDESRRIPVQPGYDIQYLYGPEYRKNISLRRLKNHRMVAREFAALAAGADPKPDVVVASIPTAELAVEAVRFGNRRGVPVVLDIRDLWPDVFFDVLPALARPLVRMLSISMNRAQREASRQATAIIGLTEGFVEWGLSRAGRSRGPLDRVFFMGYQGKPRPAAASEAAARFWDELGVDDDPQILTVAFVGTLGFMFDFDPVFEAARSLESRGAAVRFVICGDGARRKAIETAAAGLSNVVFPGWVTEDRIETLFARSAVGLTPYIESTNFILNLPNKPAEYMNGGLALAHGLGRGELFRLIEERGCGFSYAGDGEVLAEQLAALAAQAGRLAGLRDCARATFSELLQGQSVYGEMVSYLEGIAGQENR